MIQCIKVFEQERLKIGERGFTKMHWTYLAAYLEREVNSKYFKLLPNGVRFKNYVGVIQIEDLVLEILPKTDKKGETADWQAVLIEMLRICRLLPVETVGFASLQSYSNHILDLYIELFLNEIDKILQRGLLKKYRRQKDYQGHINGRLLLNKQLHQIQKDRFFVDKEVFDYNHSVHGNLLACLLLLSQMPLRNDLEARIQTFIYRFRELQIAANWKINQHPLPPKMTHYEEVVNIAHLLLKNKRPDIKFGQQKMIALLFDMNALFEEYVYRQLLRYATNEIKVERQLSKPFWQRHSIRPDIIIEIEGHRIVLDTKWRLLKQAQPSAHDLKQLFVYMNYFDAQIAYLLYPKVDRLVSKPPRPYATKEHLPQMLCGLTFCEILKDKRLNTNLGKELIEALRMDQNQLTA